MSLNSGMSSGRGYVLSIATGRRKTDKGGRQKGKINQQDQGLAGSWSWSLTEGFYQEIGGGGER